MALRSRWRYKYDWLIGHGCLPFEAREIARQYSMNQIRRLPYLHNFIRSRGLTIRRYRQQDLTNVEIRDRVLSFYKNNDLVVDSRPDIWSLIRRYRKASIEDNDYIQPKRPGSHHKGGISKGDLQGQRQRRRRKTTLEKYEEGRYR